MVGNAEVASNLQSAINMGARQAQEQALLQEGSNLVGVGVSNAMKDAYDTVQQAPGMARAIHQATAGGGVVPTTGQRLLEVGRALAGAAATPAGRVAVGVAETAAVQGTNWAQAPVVPRRVGGRGIGRGAQPVGTCQTATPRLPRRARLMHAWGALPGRHRPHHRQLPGLSPGSSATRAPYRRRLAATLGTSRACRGSCASAQRRRPGG